MSKKVVKKVSKKSANPVKTNKIKNKVSKGKKEERRQMEKRDVLINQYLPYAASIAGRVMQMLSSAVDYDDVMCYARLGLLEAAERFDPSMNVDFKTFAYYRIKGAIYDGLRKSGWVPRALYAKIKFEQATNNYLEYMSSNRSLDVDDDQKAAEVYDTVNSLASIYVISIDASDEPMEIEDTSVKNSENVAQFQQLKEHMKSSIEVLPSKERKLIKMYYFQNKTLEEAGAELGLSKSWTSRLHARALEMLFKKVNARIHHSQGTTLSPEECEEECQFSQGGLQQ
jgi:RNA polymerase sigma factor for flagellar operon FliA